MSLLTRQQILEAMDIKTEKVSVPEWGGDVLVTTISAEKRDAIQNILLKDPKKVSMVSVEKMKVLLCSFAIVDQDGKQLFTEEDVDALYQKSSIALDRVFQAAEKLNSITGQGADELRKNS
jgi:hypothetical protein